MSVKLRNLQRWQLMDETVPLPGKLRTVTIQVNVEKETKLTALQEGRATLLRVVQPWECPVTISWVVFGECSLVGESDGEIWWSTDDGLILSYDVLSESFTKLQQRMEMTPEMEVVLYKAAIRREQRAREVAELMLAKAQREDAAAAGADPETGEVDDETEEPANPDPGAAEPGTPAGNSPASKP